MSAVIQSILHAMVFQVHDQCFRRWKIGGAMRLAPTLRDHCLLYFVPSNLTHALLSNLGHNDPSMLTLYNYMIESSRQKFELYTDLEVSDAFVQWEQRDGQEFKASEDLGR